MQIECLFYRKDFFRGGKKWTELKKERGKEREKEREGEIANEPVRGRERFCEKKILKLNFIFNTVCEFGLMTI